MPAMRSTMAILVAAMVIAPLEKLEAQTPKNSRPDVATPGDWPQFLGPHRNGLSDEKD